MINDVNKLLFKEKNQYTPHPNTAESKVYYLYDL